MSSTPRLHLRYRWPLFGVISRRYGQTPKCPRSNPDALSIAELESNEGAPGDRQGVGGASPLR